MRKLSSYLLLFVALFGCAAESGTDSEDKRQIEDATQPELGAPMEVSIDGSCRNVTVAATGASLRMCEDGTMTFDAAGLQEPVVVAAGVGSTETGEPSLDLSTRELSAGEAAVFVSAFTDFYASAQQLSDADIRYEASVATAGLDDALGFSLSGAISDTLTSLRERAHHVLMAIGFDYGCASQAWSSLDERFAQAATLMSTLAAWGLGAMLPHRILSTLVLATTAVDGANNGVFTNVVLGTAFTGFFTLGLAFFGASLGTGLYIVVVATAVGGVYTYLRCVLSGEGDAAME